MPSHPAANPGWYHFWSSLESLDQAGRRQLWGPVGLEVRRKKKKKQEAVGIRARQPGMQPNLGMNSSSPPPSLKCHISLPLSFCLSCSIFSPPFSLNPSISQFALHSLHFYFPSHLPFLSSYFTSHCSCESVPTHNISVRGDTPNRGSFTVHTVAQSLCLRSHLNTSKRFYAEDYENFELFSSAFDTYLFIFLFV